MSTDVLRSTKRFVNLSCKRIGQSIFDFPRLFLPVCRIGKPSRTVRHISPRPNLRNARRQRIDFTIGPVGPMNLLRHESLVHCATTHEVGIDGGDQIGMLSRGNSR